MPRGRGRREYNSILFVDKAHGWLHQLASSVHFPPFSPPVINEFIIVREIVSYAHPPIPPKIIERRPACAARPKKRKKRGQKRSELTKQSKATTYTATMPPARGKATTNTLCSCRRRGPRRHRTASARHPRVPLLPRHSVEARACQKACCLAAGGSDKGYYSKACMPSLHQPCWGPQRVDGQRTQAARQRPRTCTASTKRGRRHAQFLWCLPKAWPFPPKAWPSPPPPSPTTLPLPLLVQHEVLFSFAGHPLTKEWGV